jgi:hypothetical protein
MRTTVEITDASPGAHRWTSVERLPVLLDRHR